MAMRAGTILIAAAAALAAPAGCARRPGNPTPAGGQPGERYVTEMRELLGTFVTVKVHTGAVGEKKTSAAVAAAFDEASRLQGLLDAHSPESEVSRISALPAGGSAEVSPATAEALAAALSLAERSGGAFDPTVGPLVRRYKEMMIPGVAPRLPEEATLARWLSKVGHRRLGIEGRAVTAKEPVELDLGAIAKGFVVDRMVGVLRDVGARHVLVDAGGDVRVCGGKAEGTAWQIGVEHPRVRGSALVGRIELRDGAVATSGDKQQYFETEGRRYSHIVDPRTGLPVSGPVGSVSVVAPTCTEADGLATTLTVLGPEEGAKLLEGRTGLGAMFILVDEEGAVTMRRIGDFPEMADMDPYLDAAAAPE